MNAWIYGAVARVFVGHKLGQQQQQ